MKPPPSHSSRYLSRHRLPGALFIGALAALIATLLNAAPVLGLSATAGLAQTELRLLQQRLDAVPLPPNPDIVLIAIEDSTPELLGLGANTDIVPRAFHARLTRALRNAGAAVLLFDLLFDSPRDPEGDEAFRSALKDSAPLQVVLAMAYDPETASPDADVATGWLYRHLRPCVLPEPAPANVACASAIAWDPNKTGDGVILLRPDSGGAEVPHVSLAAALGMLSVPVSEARWLEGRVCAGSHEWECGADREIITRFTDEEGFRKLEYSDALQRLSRPESAGEFRGKTLIVGDFTGADFKHTRVRQMHGAEFNAHAINTLLQPRAAQIGTLPLPVTFAWAWLLAFLASGFLATTRWRTIAPGAVGVLILTLVAPQLVLIWFKTNLFTLTPALAVVLSLGATALIGSSLAGRLLPAHVRAGRSEETTEAVTVVFVDLRNSTPMVEKLGAKRAGKAQAHLLSLLSVVIRKNRGEVERTMGDGLLALFRAGGTPHATRALSAVGEMLKVAEQISPEWETAFGMPAGLTIGVESGEVTGSVVITEDSEEWSSSGLTVNIAARLQGACAVQGVDVLLGPGLLAAASKQFEIEPIGELNLKGIASPIMSYTLGHKSPRG